MISWRRMEMSICLRNHIIRNRTVKLNEQFKPSKTVWRQEKQKMGICKPSWAGFCCTIKQHPLLLLAWLLQSVFMKRKLQTRLDLLRPSVVEWMKNYQEVTNWSKWLILAVKLDSVLMCLCVCDKKLNFLSWAIRPVFAEPVTNDEDFELLELQSEQFVERNLPAADTSPIVMPTEDSNSRSPVVGEQQASELVQVPQLCHNTQRELTSRQIVILNWTFKIVIFLFVISFQVKLVILHLSVNCLWIFPYNIL